MHSQAAAERERLMELHRAHDEKANGVRPDLVLDTTADDAGWIRNPAFWRRPEGIEG